MEFSDSIYFSYEWLDSKIYHIKWFLALCKCYIISNNLSYPIFVVVTASSNNILSQKFIYGYVDNIMIIRSAASDANYASGWLNTSGNVTFIVPPGSNYKVVKNDTNVVLQEWHELH